MTSIEKINLHKSSPTTLIVGGANNLGVEVANALISNDGFVILVDEFSDNVLRKFSELSKSDYFIFLDKSSLDEISRNLVRLDYIFYLVDDSQDPSKVISSDYFLQASNSLNTVLKLAIKYKSRFELITSILAHQHLLAYKLRNTAYSGMNAMNYTHYEVQRYLESLVFEYFKKSNLDVRIVRLAEIIGNGIDLSITSQIADFTKKAVLSQKIIVEGDGLNSNYLINLKDAVSGIVKAMFAKKTSGKIISVSNADAITTLALSYKIGEIEKNSVGVEFRENDSQNELIELVDVTQNWELINWKPKVSVERSIAQTIDDVYKYFGFVSNIDTPQVADKNNKTEQNSKVAQDPQVINKKAKDNTLDSETPEIISSKLNSNNTNKSSFKSSVLAKENNLKIKFEDNIQPKTTKTIYQDQTLDIGDIKQPISKFDEVKTQNKESFVYEQEIRQANLSRIIAEGQKKSETKVVNVIKVKKLPLFKRIGITTIIFACLATLLATLLLIFLILPITQVYRKISDVNSAVSTLSSTQNIQNQITSLQSVYESQNSITKPLISQILDSKLDNLTQLNYFLKIYGNYESYLTSASFVSYNQNSGTVDFLDSSNNVLNSVIANYSDYLLLKNTLTNTKSKDSLIQNYISNKTSNLPKFTN